MFVRKKKNKSGLISVQVIDKSSGRYRVKKTIGSSSNPNEIQRLYHQGLQWIKSQQGQLGLDFADEKSLFQSLLNGIQQITIAGTTLLLGKLFAEIGFDRIEESLFRHLVFARLCFPVSKLKTTDYLRRYHSLDLDEDSIYRYMDKLYSSHKDTIQQISYQHTLSLLEGRLGVVFYDVTTLYFEIDQEDDLRKTGFSKEGKHQNPQIVLGLLVSTGGYPLAYEIFEGNQFEGHTLLPVLDGFKARYQLNQLVVVADSGLLSNKNIEQLQAGGYAFILGARIKNEAQPLRDKICALPLKNGETKIIHKQEGIRLLINYSESRAKKDQRNRQKGLARLEKKLRSGRLTKASINNRGYNKYLKLDGQINVSIDWDKFEKDAQWDGLKGYLTNSKLSKQQVLDNYKHLWKIEYAFRVAKSDLKIRPIYHRLQRRIETHICISFVAYKIYKELERQLKAKKSSLSPEKAIEIAKTIYSVEIETPSGGQRMKRTLLLNEEQKKLAELFNF